MYDILKIEDKEYPIKFSKKVIALWEKKTGKHRTELVNNALLEEEFIYMHLALEEGHKQAKKKFSISMDDLWELDEQHDFYNKVFELVDGKEKK